MKKAMTMLLDKCENRLACFYDKLKKNPKKEFWFGLLIYTVIFAIICAGTLGRILYHTGTIYGSDGAKQYYPMLINFRDNAIHFFSSIKNGSFSIKMMNYDFMFGSDTMTTVAGIFAPLFPVFLITAFIPETSLGLFSACIIIGVSYFSGITNIIMCRHFKANVLWSCIFAPTYVFCGNYFYTIMWNPQFLYMLFIFPVMIIGIDNILNNKSPVLYIFSISFLSLSGFVLLIYTLPFVVLFAAIRLYIISKHKYFIRLFSYFFKGFLYSIFGVMLIAFGFMPGLYSFFNSFRTSSETGNILKLLIPSSQYISDTLYCYDINRSIGLCPILIPFIIFCALYSKAPSKHKFLEVVVLVLCSLPIIRFGLNGFSYDLCRWGFIPSCYFSFLAAFIAPELFKIKKAEFITLIISTLLFLIIFPFNLQILILLLISLSAILSSSSYICNKAQSIRKKAVQVYQKLSDKAKHYFKIGTFIVLILSAILIIELFILSPYYNVSRGLIYVLIALLIIYAFQFLNISYSNLIKTLGALFLTLPTVVYLVTCKNELNPKNTVNPDPFLESISSYDHNLPSSDSFNRFSSIDAETNNFIFNTPTNYEDAKDKETLFEIQYNDSDLIPNPQFNYSLRYRFPSTDIFFSLIDGDYMNFLTKSEMDATSLSSQVDTWGYSNKEVIYSLFGIKYFFSDSDNTHLYGKTPVDDFSYEDKKLYTNNYALPIGVTYDTFSSETQFKGFNPAELPYAMMNSVFLENDNTAANNTLKFSKELDFKLEQKQINSVSKDNTITINSDTSNGFVYLKISGLKYTSLSTAYTNDFHLFINDKDEFIYPIINENSAWQWKYPRNNYTFSIGFFKESINTIKFITFFDYDDIKIYYIPENVYTDGYNKICAEPLKNVQLGTNTLTGNIDVSSDKVLCINLLHNDGWKAYVDDVETPIYKANGLFLGIKLKTGSHKIRLEYRTPWLNEGIAVSILSYIILITVIIIKKKKKRTAQNA